MMTENIVNGVSIIDRIHTRVAELQNAYLELGSDIGSLEDKVVNGLIHPKDYLNYRMSAHRYSKAFDEIFANIGNEINVMSNEVRAAQPELDALTADNANITGSMPDGIALGDAVMDFGESRSLKVPNCLKLPLEKPLYLFEGEKNTVLASLLLRTVFAMPMGKCEITVYDSANMGEALDSFNVLLRTAEVFPEKKILTNKQDFHDVLVKMLSYVENLLQEEFPKYAQCRNWRQYNELMLKLGRSKKVLSYKIICFFGMHEESINNECLPLFQRLVKMGPKVGILPIFSIDQAALEPDKYGHVDRQVEKILRLMEEAAKIDDFVAEWPQKLQEKGLNVTFKPEFIPDYDSMYDLLLDYRNAIEANRKPSINFGELINLKEAYTRDTTNGIFIPIGSAAKNGDVVELRFGDPAKNASPHALLGGATGSGKSNLLHVIINSACCNYSPDELNLYLMDFKDGVEFYAYASPYIMPHAKLIATQADPEYGYTVLEFLNGEIKRRNDIFKEAHVKDFAEYRKKQNAMPRILFIVDEFQRIFEGIYGDNARDVLFNIARQGRSAGVHMLLATQSLKGLNLSSVQNQFAARIALKCSASDSEILLGSYNNHAAVSLTIPWGILNTSGLEEDNVKFATPEAKPESVADVVATLSEQWENEGREIETKLFNGAEMPGVPEDDYEFDSLNGVQMTLGVCMDYAADNFRVKLEPTQGNNILICGEHRKMRQGILMSIVKSADANYDINEIVYIGKDADLLPYTIKKVKKYINTKDFVQEFKAQDEEESKKSRLIVLDRRNLVKEIDFKGTTLKNEAKDFYSILTDGNEQNSFVVAFHDNYKAFKEAGSQYTACFDHRIAYDMTPDDINDVAGYTVVRNKAKIDMRAAYCYKGRLTWFRPFVEKGSED